MENKFFKKIGIGFSVLILILILKLTYINVKQEERLSSHKNNPRLGLLEEQILRGTFYDSNGIVLTTGDTDKRYIYDDRYTHSIGYNVQGKSNLEKSLNYHLIKPTITFEQVMANFFKDDQFQGRDIHITLDNRLQKVSQQALKNYTGAVVGIEPSTGQIKFMYSSPSFDSNTVKQNWSSLINDTKNSPLINRATQGLYPPGSIFKIIPTIAMLKYYNNSWEDITFDCKGYIEIDGNKVHCYNKTAHGKIDLKQAFTLSCNTYFLNLINYVSPKRLERVADNLLFNEKFDTDIEISPSRLEITEENNFSQTLSYMGQGKTLVTPIHMATLAGIIANDGIYMQPYLIDAIYDRNGLQIQKALPKNKGVLIPTKYIEEIAPMMENVVKNGTARQLAKIPMLVAGKTGTAENETANAHSWFIGYAENNGEKIAFAVIIESHEKVALNVAELILNEFLEITT
ncbi:hypothetical protein AN396_00465 [Candidatus Epulonipiscium fishelsonii]|uniref:Uncharacterized protein n=1 Tax=Candidatus Epulonipiscium fishelsonii TaxID=77094 RepID=A0ACC8XFV2_9FIRM|nr:hypothetical protein AN396_00465 [Epulopiscium sp. SCG-B11WGA-EpuloA1]